MTCFGPADWTTLNQNNNLFPQAETSKREYAYLKTAHYKNRGWNFFADEETFIARTLNGYRTKGLKMLKKDSEIFEFLQFGQYSKRYTRSYVTRRINEGCLFYVDASAFGELADYGGTAPILVLKLTYGRMRPLFIQTSRDPDSYVFTPHDRFLWKLGMRVFEGANQLLQIIRYVCKMEHED